MAGLDDSLLSDVLFGHRKGAVTGADKGQPPLAGDKSAPVLSLKEAEAGHIISALQYTNNNISHAARLLGIDYTTLHRKLKKISSGR